MLLSVLRFLAAVVFTLLAAGPAGAATRQVIVVVFDGMRPDFITATATPNLWALLPESVFFAQHHSVFVSATEVNGTAIATGMYPSHSSVIANVDFRPSIDPQATVAIENPVVIAKGDATSGGHYLRAPTVAEILHAAGIRTVVAGSKQVALLHDRFPRNSSDRVSPVLFEGETFPLALRTELTERGGVFPEIGSPGEKTARDAWTTKALIDSLWKQGVPAYTLLWLAEPDYSQHTAGPGSALALAGIRSSDEKLGQIVAEISRRGLKDSTDIMVVSDHGFSTLGHKVDVATEISRGGFAAKRAAPGGLKRGDVMVVSEGGSSLFYVAQHERATTERLAAFLQQQPWSGVILSREGLPGCFPLAEARIDSAGGPDLVDAFQWNAEFSVAGARGIIASDAPPNSPRMGGHASLSAYDLHNILIATGPDFRAGVRNTLPTGNTDLAPTILWILGQREAAAKMDGRVLTEALVGGGPPLRSYEIRRIHAEQKLPAGTWRQYLEFAELNGVRYLDEGGGTLTPPTGR